MASSRRPQSGIPAASAVLPSEDRAAYDALVALYYRHFRPVLPEERLYLDEVIQSEWLLRRLQRTETELNSYVHQDCFYPDAAHPVGQPAAIHPKVFSSLQWRLNATRKARREALTALRKLRDNPIPPSAAWEN
jgi:hypothetical protein